MGVPTGGNDMVKLILYAALSIAIALLIIGTASSAAGQTKETKSTPQNVESISGSIIVTNGSAVSFDLPETDRDAVLW
jgi:hypothetical protein